MNELAFLVILPKLEASEECFEAMGATVANPCGSSNVFFKLSNTNRRPSRVSFQRILPRRVVRLFNGSMFIP